MTYRVFHGDALAMSSRDRHLEERVQVERFSTEHEALNRARQLIEADETIAVAICDAAGNQLSGVRLQLKLGHYTD
jgi:pantothenate synthetase